MSGHNDPQSGPLIQSRYQIQRKLGQGSMGEVLLVYDVYMERSVAMKLIRLPKKLTEVDLLRFIEEAKCQGQLQHPGIISVYDIGQTQDGRIFFTMRAVEGIEFSNLIKAVHQTTSVEGLWGVSEEGWSFRRLIHALKQCADAVGFAHDQDVVHRDLKPQNLMIGSHREPLVLDWGVAKLLTSEDANDSMHDHHTQESPSASLAELPTNLASSVGSNSTHVERTSLD